MQTIYAQLIVTFVLSWVNIILVVQNLRWLLYSLSTHGILGFTSPYVSYDVRLEVPGILIFIATAYILLYQLTFNIWRLRDSVIGDKLRARAIVLNSVLLIALAFAGGLQWIVFSSFLPPELVVLVAVGVVSASAALYLEVRTRRAAL